MFNTRIFENSYSGGQPSSAINIPNANNDVGGDFFNIPQPIDIAQQRQPSILKNSKLRRESIAHSQGMGGVSWGSVTIGSWLKDEVMMLTNSNNNTMNNGGFLSHTHHILNPRRGSFRHHINHINPSISLSLPTQASYLPYLEADYCKDYVCCGQMLPTLHDLLRHYEETHISPSPPPEQTLNPSRNRTNRSNMHNIMETVSTNDVFLNNQENMAQGQTQFELPTHQQFNIQNQTINQMSLNSTIPQTNQIPNSDRSQNVGEHMSQASIQSESGRPPSLVASLLHLSGSDSGNSQPDEDDAMYIDDPARHLYVMENNEYKPYKCQVIGCDKMYKNQNGLKYHRLHGHQNQTLKENPDGTISIINPESNTPYLDGTGMEKDKPYRCEVCGKRYKNLNGLKYHRGHTTH